MDMVVTVPLPTPSKKAVASGIFSSAGGSRPKLPATGNPTKRQQQSQCCWLQPSSSSSRPRLCSLSMLLISLFLFGSVPPAPPIGLLTMHLPSENEHDLIIKKVTTIPSNFSSASKSVGRPAVVVVPAPTQLPRSNHTRLTPKSPLASCFHKVAVEKDCDMSYLAVFPGSGSELCLELIEGLTGIKTGHAYPFIKNNTSQKVVTMKTHYPNRILRGGNPKHSPVPVTRAILLLRNPMNALPSFFNFLFEQKSHQQHHYFQAPIEEWITWRDDDFASKLYLWRFHMDYWLSQYHLLPSSSSSLSASSLASSNNDADEHKRGNKTMILIGFEKLVHKTKGPLVLQELSHYLQQHDNVTSITTPSQVACAWDHIVVRRSANKRGDRGKRRRKTIDRYVPPYRDDQLQDMIDMLQWQRDRYRDQYPQLIDILDEYLATVKSRWQAQNSSQPISR